MAEEYYINCIGALGDIVACEPIARFLKKLHPSAKIFWIVKPAYKDIVLNNPNIDDVLVVQTLYESGLVCEQKRKIGANVIDCHFNGRICEKTGEKHFNPCDSGITFENIFKNSSILRSFSIVAGLPPINDAPKFYIKDNIVVDGLPKDYVVIHCKSSLEQKDWTEKKWNKFVSKLVEMNIHVVEIGQENIINNKSPFYHNFTSVHDIQKIAYIIKNSICFVGIDSGFAHIANCFDKYAILIFGRYLKPYKEYNPYSGNYWNYKNCSFIYTRDYSKYIPVNLVLKVFESYINGKKKYKDKRIYYSPLWQKLRKKLFSIQNCYKNGVKRKQILIFGIKIKWR